MLHYHSTRQPCHLITLCAVLPPSLAALSSCPTTASWSSASQMMRAPPPWSAWTARCTQSCRLGTRVGVGGLAPMDCLLLGRPALRVCTCGLGVAARLRASLGAQAIAIVSCPSGSFLVCSSSARTAVHAYALELLAWCPHDNGTFPSLYPFAVHVRMSPNPVPTINNADQTTDWFNSIERCFHW